METKTAVGMSWVKAVAECFPKLKLSGLMTLQAELQALADGGVWSGGLGSAEGFKRVGLRYKGSGKGYAAWAEGAGRALGLKLPAALSAAPRAAAWLELVWNAETGKIASSALGSSGDRAEDFLWRYSPAAKAPARSILGRQEFSPALFGDLGLETAFSQFAALCPVEAMVSESVPRADGSLEPGNAWALALKTPVPWPLLLRLDVSAPLAAAAPAQTSFLLLNRPVAELSFTKESMWAWFLD